MALMLPTFTKKDTRPMDFYQTMQKNAAERGLLGPRPEPRPVPAPNAAHDQLMQKAEALVTKVAKSGAGKPLTIEQAFEKVLTDPANLALARQALRPRPIKGVPTAQEVEDENDGEIGGDLR